MENVVLMLREKLNDTVCTFSHLVNINTHIYVNVADLYCGIVVHVSTVLAFYLLGRAFILTNHHHHMLIKGCN